VTGPLDRALRVLDSEVGGLPSSGMLAHPGGKWCPAEIVEHLALACSATTTGLKRCLQIGRPISTPTSWKQRVAGAYVMGLGRLPAGREAPAFARPRGLAPAAAIQSFRDQIEALDRTLRECEARFGADLPLLSHPALGAMSAAQWRRYHWIHTRHHVAQIRQRVRRTA
jgi:hypothetical protein